MGSPKIKRLSIYYGVNPAWVMGLDVPKYLEATGYNPTKTIPLLGKIACGSPILATENIDSYVATDAEDDTTFCLLAKGDSMVGARITDGDVLFIRAQDVVENGDIAAVLIEEGGEYEATVKRYYRYGNTVVLRPENSEYEEMTFTKGDINKLKIIGKVVSFKSEVV